MFALLDQDTTGSDHSSREGRPTHPPILPSNTRGQTKRPLPTGHPSASRTCMDPRSIAPSDSQWPPQQSRRHQQAPSRRAGGKPPVKAKQFAKENALTPYKRQLREDLMAEEEEKRMFRQHPLPGVYFEAKVGSPIQYQTLFNILTDFTGHLQMAKLGASG